MTYSKCWGKITATINCQPILPVKENKTTMRYHFIFTRMTMIKRWTTSVGQNVEMLDPVYIALYVENGTTTV